MKIRYVAKRLGAEKMDVIRQVNAICAAYARDGFDLTLRQLYYQFVARGLFPEDRTYLQVGGRWVKHPAGSPNADPNYKWLGDIVNDGRLAGLIDWDYIVDRTRNIRSLPSWNHPRDVIRASAEQFRIPRWNDQPTRIEVWIEKDALVGVISAVCNDNRVTYFSCRGYTSQSEIWSAAQRVGSYLREGQDVTILHLGDHDPSGIDMTRDIRDRLDLFTGGDNARAAVEPHRDWLQDAYERTGTTTLDELKEASPETYAEFIDKVQATFAPYGTLTVKRIALNMDQITAYRPPPNPAKVSDSRAAAYIAEYGEESWELDALEPPVLAALIQEEIDDVKDHAQWEADENSEEQHRRNLGLVDEGWDEVAEALGFEAS
jgi:hypothetical protein